MKTESSRRAVLLAILSALAVGAPLALGMVDDNQTPGKAFLDGTGPGFRRRSLKATSPPSTAIPRPGRGKMA